MGKERRKRGPGKQMRTKGCYNALGFLKKSSNHTTFLTICPHTSVLQAPPFAPSSHNPPPPPPPPSNPSPPPKPPLSESSNQLTPSPPPGNHTPAPPNSTVQAPSGPGPRCRSGSRGRDRTSRRSRRLRRWGRSRDVCRRLKIVVSDVELGGRWVVGGIEKGGLREVNEEGFGKGIGGKGMGQRVSGKGRWEMGAPIIINHSGFCTRSASDCGSRRACQSVSSASLISDSVRWRMKTGLPRHLMMTCMCKISLVLQSETIGLATGQGNGRGGHTFFPSGIASSSISTLACARTSAEAAMLTRKSVGENSVSGLNLPV